MPVLPEYGLAGKTAILATSGGEEATVLAQALAEAGATVFVVARRQRSLDSALGALAGLRSRHGGVVAEVATSVGLAEAMRSFDLSQKAPSLSTEQGHTGSDAPHLNPLPQGEGGGIPSPSTGEAQDGGEASPEQRRVDILVNDARSYFAKPFTEVTLEEWDAIQSRNVRATFLLCQEVGRRMMHQQYGRIVNLISGLAERGMINGSAFSASQAAVLSLTRSLAVEWGQHNIRVNAIGAGWSTAAEIPVEVQQQELLVRYIPLRHKGHPRDIGPLLVYLCSEACDYSTGQPVYVDGGLNAHP